jgi:hypothetical protein
MTAKALIPHARLRILKHEDAQMMTICKDIMRAKRLVTSHLNATSASIPLDQDLSLQLIGPRSIQNWSIISYKSINKNKIGVINDSKNLL